MLNSYGERLCMIPRALHDIDGEPAELFWEIISGVCAERAANPPGSAVVEWNNACRWDTHRDRARSLTASPLCSSASQTTAPLRFVRSGTSSPSGGGWQLMTRALQLDPEGSRPNDGLPPPTEEGSATDRDLSIEGGVASIWHEARL